MNKQSSKPELKMMDISSFLIMPIQRIPRYVLLLEDLLKCSPGDHIDNQKLQEALTGIKKVAVEINQKKAAVENFAKLVEIHNKLDPPIEDLCAAHRHFVKEGVLKEEGKEFVFLLFNDIMLKCKENGKKN